ETQSPEDRFKDLQVYRAELRSALNTAKLDDVHDRDGNALYRLQFIATVFPGAGETKKHQWGVARVVVEPPTLSRQDIERLYLRLLMRSTVRLNLVNSQGDFEADSQYTSLVNYSDFIGSMFLTPCIYTHFTNSRGLPSP